jgi:hypothetical protein
MIYTTDLENIGEEKDASLILYCTECFGEFSATKGDYFWKAADIPFTHCGYPMALVRKIETIEVVKT